MQHAARRPKTDYEEPGDGQTSKRKERAPSSSSFPTKLYKILADPQYREYITWLPHGRAWRVLKPKAFEEDVIPKFFRSERYASFMRQVSVWTLQIYLNAHIILTIIGERLGISPYH